MAQTQTQMAQTAQTQTQAGHLHVGDLTNKTAAGWTVTVRVVNKSGVLLSHDGLKKYFTLLLVDNTGEIRAVAFGNDVDRLHPLFREHEVVSIGGGELTVAHKTFNRTDHGYEIVLNDKTSVTAACTRCSVPLHGRLTPINELMKSPLGSIKDTIGIITDVDTPKLRGSQQSKVSLSFELTDNTGSHIAGIMWGDVATAFRGVRGDVLAVIKGVVTEYQAVRQITIDQKTTGLHLNPPWDETTALKNWYARPDNNLFSQSSSVFSQSSSPWQQRHINPAAAVAAVAASQTSSAAVDDGAPVYYTRILTSIREDDEALNKRLRELDEQHESIERERSQIAFKKQRLSIEKDSIINRKSNVRYF